MVSFASTQLSHNTSQAPSELPKFRPLSPYYSRPIDYPSFTTRVYFLDLASFVSATLLSSAQGRGRRPCPRRTLLPPPLLLACPSSAPSMPGETTCKASRKKTYIQKIRMHYICTRQLRCGFYRQTQRSVSHEECGRSVGSLSSVVLCRFLIHHHAAASIYPRRAVSASVRPEKDNKANPGIRD